MVLNLINQYCMNTQNMPLKTPNIQPISITDSALERMFCLLKGKKDYLGIRVKVSSGGCCGKKYSIEYAKTQEKYDEVIYKKHDQGILCVFIDPKTMLTMMGSTIDYKKSKLSSHFIFDNPKEKRRCGCGKSFN